MADLIYCVNSESGCMIIKREITSAVRIFLDTWVPPVIRDTYWFMYPIAVVAFGKHAKTFLNFRKTAFRLTPTQYAKTYEMVNPLFTRETDLTMSCVRKIESSIAGSKILEVGSGRGYLAKRLAKKYQVTACDIVIDSLVINTKQLKFIQAPVEKLPFGDKTFDTVITTHTLEHVLDFEKAISELRRVTKKRLIIVIPMQKPFLYTLDLHVRFFPYPYTFIAAMRHGMGKKYICLPLDGDLFYYEDR